MTTPVATLSRREMFGAFGAGAAAWTGIPWNQSLPASASRHTIDRFEVFRVKVNQRGDWVLLRTRSAAGLTGSATARTAATT